MEGPSRHMCKGHMDKDKRGNLRVGGGKGIIRERRGRGIKEHV